MRITNGILINNSLNNINANKTKMDTLNTQLVSEKKIARPSDDPMIAIRSLRYRSTLSEINQYLDKNIPDASSWMTCTDDAMGNVVGILGDIANYCEQAVNGYYDERNKATIVEELKALRDQIYNDANADCAGRKIFAGYKTDSTLVFTEDTDSVYEINQKLDKSSVECLKKITGKLDTTGIDQSNIGTVDVSSIEVADNQDTYRIMLAYNEIDSSKDAKITLADGTEISLVMKKSTESDAYTPADGEACLLADTGEIILGKSVYSDVYSSEGFTVNFTKSGFKKGDLDPKQYFDCKDVTDSDPDKQIEYTRRNQDINYEVNFSQMLTINTQGKDVFTHEMTRDMDEIINVVNTVIDVTNKKEQLQKIYNNTAAGSEERKKAEELLRLCDRELDFANENMKNAFSEGITKYQKHMDFVSLARADVGARQNRLELNKTRLETQKTTIKNLMSINEEVNTVDVAVELKEASSIYDASLKAASMVVKSKLLDFI